MLKNLLATKPVHELKAAGENDDLRRTLGPAALTAIGVGAIIGAGIFVLTGIAAANYAGPAIVLSFVLAGIGCAFAGLCYAEFAAMIFGFRQRVLVFVRDFPRVHRVGRACIRSDAQVNIARQDPHAPPTRAPRFFSDPRYLHGKRIGAAKIRLALSVMSQTLPRLTTQRVEALDELSNDCLRSVGNTRVARTLQATSSTKFERLR